ncbi:hypothetical protein P8452_17397 [Trifolium repens]|nr:hypothetical protein P8452_17397 [Trifolium repens]
MPCKTFIPGEWLKLHNSVGQCKPSLGTGFDSVTKKLFHTPSPKSTLGQSSKYALIYRPYNLSKSKSRLTGFESVSKKTKHSERVIPKGAKLHFCPPVDILLAPKEAQDCAYLFQKTNDKALMLLPIVKVDNLTASRADLQCLLPN